jgi:quercetin dioxygenase-like cupin family protein
VIPLRPSSVELAPITDFESVGAFSGELANGSGEAHIHFVEIAAGGEIGPHIAGFGQIFLCLEGTGWIAASDGQRIPIQTGEAVHVARGELHSKGSLTGMRGLIVQVHDLSLCPSSNF